MSYNYFNQEEDEEFRDTPDEVNNQSAPPVKSNNVPKQVRPTVQEQEPVIEEPEEIEVSESEEEEEDFSSVLMDARLRLEQGRLYEMIMNHNIFAGADADEKAIKYVTRQIRNFAKEQMEIMLGMRQETSKSNAMLAENFPFNNAEVQALKDLAYVATKGASAAQEAQSFTPAPVVPRRTGLNQINVKSTTKAVQKPAPKVQAKPVQHLKSQAKSPIKRNAQNEAGIQRVMSELGITREEYDRQFDAFSESEGKSFENMNDQEIAARQAKMAKKYGQTKNPEALPMPTFQQQEAIASSMTESFFNQSSLMQKVLDRSGRK